MNLTLSLGVNGGGAAAKKRKVMDGVGDVAAAGGGDRATVMRLLQARDRMVKVELDHEDGDVSGSGPSPLMRLLLSSAVAGEVGDTHAAAVALQEVYRHASFRGGDPAQRVAAYFADALASRLLLPPPAKAKTTTTTREEQFLAFTMFYQASPFYQFAHFTANQAIVEAFEAGGRRRLHVVDFDVSFGFQWPSLIQSLSDAATTSSSQSSQDDSGDCCDEPVSLRITGFGASADELRDTEARLARFADGCPNLRFEFEGVVNNGPEDGRHERIKTDPAATVVVNLVFPAAQNARASSWDPRSALAHIRSLNPSLVFLIDKVDEGSGGGKGAGRCGSASLLPRFAANLRYYAAVFESLHECLPADSAERIAIERDHLGVEISDAMASLDRRRHAGDRAADQMSRGWKERLESAGFEDARLSSRTVSQAKLLLKMKSGGCGGGGFRVTEAGDGKAMALGWRDRALITATAWRPCRRSVGKNEP
ncbi:scarecrow-like protein 23 [Triticum urartu]|uniref:scarecrow-like protein 23 n=1 Tax=Triticum urartu TaxID=4572 RepID=UPI002043FB7A|nr:scarecrow-like protein 23 [Triticum urartu]